MRVKRGKAQNVFIVMSNRGTENLFQLIRLGQIEKFCNNLSDADLGVLNEDGQNLLHEAVAYKQPQIATFLIHSGISINHQDKNGQTPLHYAATLNQPDLTRLSKNNVGYVVVFSNVVALWVCLNRN